MAELNDSKLNDKAIPETSAFHHKNIDAVQFITLARIYDLLAVLAINDAGEDDVKLNRVVSLLNDHEQGIIRMASPAFREN